MAAAPEPDHLPPGTSEGMAALVDRAGLVGSSSTRPGVTTDTAHGETGIDTIRFLFETESFGAPHFELPERVVHHLDETTGELLTEVEPAWRAGSIPALGLTWVEGHPVPGALATSDEVAAAATSVRERVGEAFGIRSERGVSRLDITTTRPFEVERDARAVLSGMAALELPRCDAIRRGTPVHSIAWAHSQGRSPLARCYDKGLERGGEPFRHVRLEDQRRFRSSEGRPDVTTAADHSFHREKFVRRFEPMRKAVDGVRVASLPVIARALADEVKYGYRPWREAERLAGSLVLFAGGVEPSRGESTLYRRRRDLREAGFVVAPDFLEPVEVDLGEVLEAAIAEFDG
jgi:hypothetical protein